MFEVLSGSWPVGPEQFGWKVNKGDKVRLKGQTSDGVYGIVSSCGSVGYVPLKFLKEV